MIENNLINNDINKTNFNYDVSNFDNYYKEIYEDKYIYGKIRKSM